MFNDSSGTTAETMTIYPRPKSQAVEADIGPRDNQSLEALAKLKPYFDRRWGTVTVGNACQVTDGAVGLLLMDADYAAALGHTPLGSIRSYAYAGCDPSRMGLGPVYASAKALAAAGTHLKSMDCIELNEAFAAQVLACLQAFEKPPADCQSDASSLLGPIDPERLNVNGGAIAIGHPVGATGTRLILSVLQQLQQSQSELGLATLCIGGGQGGAVVLQRHAAAA